MTERPSDSLYELRERGASAVNAPLSRLIGMLLLHTFLFACIFSLLFVLISLASGWQAYDNIGPLAVPIVLGFGISAVSLLYKKVLSHHSFLLAVVAGALAIGVYSVGMGSLLTALARVPVADVGVLWHMPGAGIWGLLAAAVEAFWPGVRDSRRNRDALLVDPSLSDQEWEKQTAAHLRARGDMTDTHVRDILATARETASTGGAPLVSEFGAPSEFALRPARQRSVTARRQALLYTAITVFPAWGLVQHVIDDGWTWDAGIFWTGLWLVAAATAAVLAWHTSLQQNSEK